jgi:hypothetical protein
MEVEGGRWEHADGNQHRMEVGKAVSVWAQRANATTCRIGVGCWTYMNRVCREKLGAQPNIEPVVRTLIE